MEPKIWMSLIGALSGAVVFVGLSFAIPPLVLAAVGGGVVLALYIVASFTVGGKVGEAMRGAMVGINAALNWRLVWALIGGDAGLVIGLTLGVINFCAAFAFLSQREVFQGLLGYLNWVLPMSWPIVALGMSFLVVSGIGALALGLPLRSAFFRIAKAQVDWKTGTLFIKGGLVANLNYLHTAFNMGNFSFVDKQSGDMHIDHEAGHSLNLAAFGAVFHLIGAFDENLLRHGWKAFSERLAESNVPGTSVPEVLKMWV